MAAETSATAVNPGHSRQRGLTSCVQDGLWFLSNLNPASSAFTISRSYRVSGNLQVEALRTAWFRVLDRQQALRTTLVELDGTLLQQVNPARQDSFVLLDVDGATREQGDRISTEQAAEVLDLTHGPLSRLTVIRLSSSEHRLVLVAHQTVADESSIQLIVDELSTCYSVATGVRPDPHHLPELPCQYIEYARRQRGQVTTGHFQQSLARWTAELATLTAPITPPIGKGVDPGASPATEALEFNWGSQLARCVQSLAQAEGTTRLVVLLAAFQTLLNRHYDQEQVVVGVPVVVRSRPEFRALVGPFSNLLPIRGDLSGMPTFRQLVRQLDRTIQGGFNHRDVPFPQLLQTLSIERDPQRLPLCTATLTLREPSVELRLVGTVVRPLPPHNHPTLADLALTVTRLQPSITGVLLHHDSRVTRQAAAGLLKQLRTLLRAAVDHPDLPTRDLPLESPQQLYAVLREGGLNAPPAGAGRPVHQLIAEQAAQAPAAVAVDWDGGALTYQDLDIQARSLATRLRDFGVAEGAPVAVRMRSGPGLVTASLAALHAGAHLTWLSPGDSGERGQAVLTDLAPACLLLDHEPARDPLASWFQEQRDGRVIDLTGLPSSGAAPPTSLPHSLDQLAYVAYTSGSTGRPKGVAQPHGALAQFVGWFADAFAFGPDTRVAQWAALEHDPSLCEVFATLVAGATLCPVPPRIRAHPEKLIDWLAHERITMLQTVPSFARELLSVIAQRGSAEPLASLRQLVLMGEALPATLVGALRSALPGTRLANIYGPTETIAATWCDLSDPVPGEVTPIGRPLPGRQVLVLDELDRPCPTGVVGELVVRSPYATAGYLGRPTTDPAFRPLTNLPPGAAESPVRCYRTGDLGRRRWDGLLEFAGRRDFQVKLAGTRVELAEVEAALVEHESVADCAVTAITDQDGLVTRLVAYVAPRRGPFGQSGSPAQWRAHLRQRFGQSMVRVSFTALEHIPRSAAGKIDRRLLPDPGQVRERSATGPGSWLEEGMAEIWSELLHTQPIDVEHSFFATGGHSLQLPRLVAVVRERFGVDISLADCYANPSLAGMSMVVAAAGAHRYATAAGRAANGCPS